LHIPFGKLGVKFGVPTAFIAVGPPDNAGVIGIPGNQRLHQLAAGFGVVLAVPTTQFVHHVQAKFIAGIQESGIRRVV